MAVSLGKSKNWGSRTGKNTRKTAASHDLISKLIESDLPKDILEAIAQTNSEISKAAQQVLETKKMLSKGSENKPSLVFKTKLGKLYKGDCVRVLQSLDDNSIDCIFADPPFNLAKDYENGLNDLMPELEYLEWTRAWLDLCVTKLKPGGSLFIYNIPKWSIPISNHLNKSLTFKHWIAVDLTLSMPIPGRLFPSHYALLYYVKGNKANCFQPHRVPIRTCRKCGKEQNDYGGYKKKMNPLGINLRDVWMDIPPVRHSKFKNRDANQLHIKLLNRILDIATQEGDIVFDPFGGSGTTFVAAELKNRKWIGSELGPCEPIINRFSNLKTDKELLAKIQEEINVLFTDDALKLRAKSGLSLDAFQIYESQIHRALGDRYLQINPQLDLLEDDCCAEV